MTKHHPPLQIVNENDEPIGGASLPDAYRLGLIHRGVFIFVEDPSGKILLQKRGPTMATYPGRWDLSAAGHVDEGEDYQQAAVRELKEELGISGIALQQIDAFRDDEVYDGQHLRRFKRAYKVVIPASTPLTLNAEEVAEIMWLKPAEVRQFIKDHPGQVASGLTSTFERYYKHEDYQP